MSRWWGGVAGWVAARCPELVASGSYGQPAGLSSDGATLYALDSTSDLGLYTFPSLTFSSNVDLNTPMNALGAGGGGNLRAAVIDDGPHLYSLGFITTGTDLQVMKCNLDGSSPSLLCTITGSKGLSPQITWHPADASNLYVLCEDDTSGSKLVRVNRSTGATTSVQTFTGTFLGRQFNQWDDGLVFFEGAGVPMAGNIWAYDFTSFDSLVVSSFGGLGTRPDGHTLWVEDLHNGDTGVHAFNISAGPSITAVPTGCADPWDSNEPLYWFATPDRSGTYVGDGGSVWSWS